MPGWVAIVYTDVDRVGLTARHGIDSGPHAFCVGEISRGGHVLSCGGRVGRIDGVDVVILVAGFILNEEDVLAIARPEVTRDRPLGVGGYRLCISEGLGRLLHPDVARAFEGFDKGDKRAVRGDLGAGNFRVTKEQLAVD